MDNLEHDFDAALTSISNLRGYRCTEQKRFLAHVNRLHERVVALAQQQEGAVEALRAVWADMRGVDKHHVPNDVLALVRAVIGTELSRHDPAASDDVDPCPYDKGAACCGGACLSDG